MKVIAEAAVLRRAVRLLSSVEKNVYPIALTARVDGGSGSLNIDTFENNKFVSLSLSADVLEEGRVIITSRHLPYLDVDHSTVLINTRKDGLKITPPGYVIAHFAGDLSTAPVHLPLGSATFQLNDIKVLFRRVLFAVGDDTDPQHNFRCVRLECGGASMKAVGGDRRVIAISDIPKGSPYVGTFTLPKGGVYLLNKLEGDLITLTFYERAIRFSVSGEIMCDILMPELAVPFPNYREVLDIRGNTILTADSETLCRQIKAAKKVSEKMYIVMKYDSSGVKQKPRFFGGEDDGQSRIDNFLDNAEWSGDELKIALNASTLEEAVENAGSKVKVSFTNDMGPLAVTGESDDYIAVMSPYSPREKR
ncbi:MAG: hypothetical protein C0402_05315 [Thermodesulfovibrio sp.]|nr:hypothetical protein [Thermodesulfovibrio sp.]